jgi:hypothetical protein
MSWASKRQSKYILGIFLFLALIAFIIIYPKLHKPSTCSDGKKNGTETGIDCGGSCSLVCRNEASDPIILWQRAFPVTGSIYNLVAYVTNQNKNAAVKMVSYEFRVYDTNNTLIGRREGTTYIPPNQEFAVFEPRFDAGQNQIRSVTFDFHEPIVWIKKAPTLQAQPIHVDNIIMGDFKTSPYLNAKITNDSVYDLPPFDVVTILYDIKHKAINASKTHKDGLRTNESALISFTWPEIFTEDPVTNDVIVEINPFEANF